MKLRFFVGSSFAILFALTAAGKPLDYSQKIDPSEIEARYIASAMKDLGSNLPVLLQAIKREQINVDALKEGALSELMRDLDKKDLSTKTGILSNQDQVAEAVKRGTEKLTEKLSPEERTLGQKLGTSINLGRFSDKSDILHDIAFSDRLSPEEKARAIVQIEKNRQDLFPQTNREKLKEVGFATLPLYKSLLGSGESELTAAQVSAGLFLNKALEENENKSPCESTDNMDQKGKDLAGTLEQTSKKLGVTVGLSCEEKRQLRKNIASLFPIMAKLNPTAK